MKCIYSRFLVALMIAGSGSVMAKEGVPDLAASQRNALASGTVVSTSVTVTSAGESPVVRKMTSTIGEKAGDGTALDYAGLVEMIENADVRSMNYVGKDRVYEVTVLKTPPFRLNVEGLKLDVDGDWGEAPLAGTVRIAQGEDGVDFVKDVNLKSGSFGNFLGKVKGLGIVYGVTRDAGGYFVNRMSLDVSITSLLFVKKADC